MSFRDFAEQADVETPWKLYPWQRRFLHAIFPPRTWRTDKSMGVRFHGWALYLKRLDRTRLYYSERNARHVARWGRLALVLRRDVPVFSREDAMEAYEEDFLGGSARGFLRMARRNV